MTDYTALVAYLNMLRKLCDFCFGTVRNDERVEGGHVGEGEFDAALGGVKGGTGRLTCADPIK